jgi:circadian clock protein KaiC
MSFFDESKIPDQLTYISGFRVMRSEGLAALLTLIRREIIARKATILVVDGLIAAQRVAESEQAFNEFVHELQGLAIAADCTVFLVASAERSGHSSPEHTMVDGILELGDESFGWATERMMQVTKIRGSAYLRGKHSYKITDDGVVVNPRTEALLAEPTNAPDSTGAERVTSGIDDLDVMLRGGLPKSSTTILLGPPGIGKTTFGLQFLAACNKDEPGLMLGFYERPSRIMAKTAQICRPLLHLFDGGLVEMLWQSSSNASLDACAERLLATVRRRGVSRLFLDGLGALQSAPGAAQRMQHFLPALTNELRAQGVTTVYSLEAVNVGPATPVSFGDLSLLAENLIVLRYVERGPKLHRLISILKVRDSDFDPLFHEFVLTEKGPNLMRSEHGAEAIMGMPAPNSV